jgi:hypothetical protein
MGMAMDLNLFNAWRSQEEGTLDTNTIGSDTPDSKVPVITTVAQANHDAANNLHTLVSFTYVNAQMNGYVVSNKQLRKFRIIFVIKSL